MTDLQLAEDELPFPEQSQLEDLVHDVVRQATGRGADAVEAGVSIDAGLSVTVRLGETETLEYNRDRSLGLTVYFNQRKGSASTADFGAESVAATVQAACDIARYTSEDEYSGLADPGRLAKVIPDLDLYHPWDISAEQAIEIARECEAAARDVDVRIENSEGGNVSSNNGMRVTANSNDFIGGYLSSYHSISCSVIGKQGAEMQRDYWSDAARDPTDLDAAANIGRISGERTARRLGTRRLTTRKAPVVFAAEIASSLFGNFIGAISGSNQYRKSSFLLDYLGKRVFPEFIHIHEQPLLKKALGSAPYDGEGVATGPRDIVRAGVLEGYVLNSYAARKLGMETTANSGGVRNLTIDPGDKNLPELLRSMGSGLLITELIGFGVNTMTGDYSRGAAGFWVEEGEIQYPVDEITVAGNLKDMFMDIIAVGNDVDLRGNTRCGSVMLGEMMIAGA